MKIKVILIIFLCFCGAIFLFQIRTPAETKTEIFELSDENARTEFGKITEDFNAIIKDIESGGEDTFGTFALLDLAIRLQLFEIVNSVSFNQIYSLNEYKNIRDSAKRILPVIKNIFTAKKASDEEIGYSSRDSLHDQEAQIAYAVMEAFSGDYRKALNDLNDVKCTSWCGNGQAEFFMEVSRFKSFIHMQLEEYEDALKISVSSERPFLIRMPESVEKMFVEAYLFQKCQKPESAFLLYQQIVDLHPDFKYCSYALNELNKAGKYKQPTAQHIKECYLKSDSGVWEDGILAMAKHGFQDSYEYIMKEYEEFSKNSRRVNYIVYALGKLKDRRAISLLKELKVKSEKDSSIHNENLVIVLAEMGEKKEQLEAVDIFLKQYWSNTAEMDEALRRMFESGPGIEDANSKSRVECADIWRKWIKDQKPESAEN